MVYNQMLNVPQMLDVPTYRNTLKRSSHFSKFDQWLGLNVTWKSDGNENLGKHLFDLPWNISRKGRKESLAFVTKVAVISLLSSTPLMEAFFISSMKMCTFPGRHTKGMSDQD